MRFLIFILTALSLSVSFTQAQTTEDKPVAAAIDGGGEPDPSHVVASVNGVDITYLELTLAYQNLPKQYQRLPISAIEEQLVGRLVEQKVLIGLAKAAELDKGEKFQAQLSYLEDSLLEQVYMADLYDKAITEEKIAEAYDKHVADLGDQFETRARHILVSEEEEAKEIIKLLEEGQDFATLAKDKSTGPTGPNGGDLGYFSKEQMVKPFSEAAFSLEPKTFTKEAVQTQFGWHVIFVEDRRAKPAPSLEELKESLIRDLQKAVLDAKLDEAVKQADVKKYPISQK
jgi:peptidyl-prolyl cis-trans isomerase C